MKNKNSRFVLGLAIGLAIGATLHNIAIGTAIGAGLAVAFCGVRRCSKVDANEIHDRADSTKLT